jgi:hypothetical protein
MTIISKPRHSIHFPLPHQTNMDPQRSAQLHSQLVDLLNQAEREWRERRALQTQIRKYVTTHPDDQAVKDLDSKDDALTDACSAAGVDRRSFPSPMELKAHLSTLGDETLLAKWSAANEAAKVLHQAMFASQQQDTKSAESEVKTETASGLRSNNGGSNSAGSSSGAASGLTAETGFSAGRVRKVFDNPNF